MRIRRQVGLAAALEDGLFLSWALALYWWELAADAKARLTNGVPRD